MSLFSRLFGGRKDDTPPEAKPPLTLRFYSDYSDPWYGELNEASDKIIAAEQRRKKRKEKSDAS